MYRGKIDFMLKAVQTDSVVDSHIIMVWDSSEMGGGGGGGGGYCMHKGGV